MTDRKDYACKDCKFVTEAEEKLFKCQNSYSHQCLAYVDEYSSCACFQRKSESDQASNTGTAYSKANDGAKFQTNIPGGKELEDGGRLGK